MAPQLTAERSEQEERSRAPASPRLLPRRPDRRATGSLAAGGAVAGAVAFLLARIAPDVAGRPLAGDEALAGLIAAEPLGDVLRIVMWERGGAPLHFVLGHVTLELDASVEALRWLSVAFALGTIPLCFDLGRRLGGRVAGASAAIVAASSGTLAISGAFGRMYALFAFAGALAADLFVRAVELRTPQSVYAAAGAAWLLPAIHPYGAAPVAAMTLVALVLWRGRPLLPALPVAAVALAMLPFAWADLQFGRRFEVQGSTEGVVDPSQAGRFLRSSLEGYAGSSGWTFVLFLALALAGATLVARRRPEVVAFVFVSVALPPLTLLLVTASSHPSLSVRHMIYALPLWAALIGVAVARTVEKRAPAARVAAVGAVAVVAGLSGFGEASERRDPSTLPRALAGPAAWLEQRVEEGDALFPYSPVYFEALPTAGRATVFLSRGPGIPTERALERLEFPVRRLYVAVLARGSAIDIEDLGKRLGQGFEPRRFGPWILVEARGPFPDSPSLIATALGAVGTVRKTATWASAPLRNDLGLSIGTLCRALRDLDRACRPRPAAA
jgi:hypothetical protein